MKKRQRDAAHDYLEAASQADEAQVEIIAAALRDHVIADDAPAVATVVRAFLQDVGLYYATLRLMEEERDAILGEWERAGVSREVTDPLRQRGQVFREIVKHFEMAARARTAGFPSDADPVEVLAMYGESYRTMAANITRSGSKKTRRVAAKEGHKNTKAQAAKVEAMHLWPEALRRGWTADRLHTQLVSKGHSVKADTVRKWVTRLRNTGTC